MTKYILNKKVKKCKANNIKDLKGINKAAWSFISSLYKAEWDELCTDSNNHSFRHKVKAQFNPQIDKRYNSKKGKDTNKLVSILNILPPILDKYPKKINKI